MRLEQIVENMAVSLKVVDEMTEIQRESRSGSGAYIPCVGTMWEDDFTREAVLSWALRAPSDFRILLKNGRSPYPAKEASATLSFPALDLHQNLALR